ncbi:MAG: hypothetical protein AAF936_03910 [Pseudomonadota bacterium]
MERIISINTTACAVLRCIIAPQYAEQHGELQPGKTMWLERIVGDADAVVVNGFKRRLVLLPEETFVDLIEANHG